VLASSLLIIALIATNNCFCCVSMQKIQGEFLPIYEIIKQADRCLANRKIEKKYIHTKTDDCSIPKFAVFAK